LDVSEDEGGRGEPVPAIAVYDKNIAGAGGKKAGTSIMRRWKPIMANTKILMALE
jgi:hypothetical protein